MYDEVFHNKLGNLNGQQTKIEVDLKVTPCLCKAQSLPYSMRAEERHSTASRVCKLGCTKKSDRKSVRLCSNFI